jgi:hypothetical protein
MVEEVSKKKQSADKGKNTYDEKHSEGSLPGERQIVSVENYISRNGWSYLRGETRVRQHMPVSRV